MLSAFRVLVWTLRRAFMSHADLVADAAALRHQLGVLQRRVKRPRLRRGDRLLSDLAGPQLAPLEVRPGDREAGDGDALAAGRLPSPLAEEAEGESRPPAHPDHAHRVQAARALTRIWRPVAGLVSRSWPRWRQQPDPRQAPGQRECEKPATVAGRHRAQVDLVCVPAPTRSSRRSPRAPPTSRPSDVSRPHLDDAAHEYELAA